jgi:hypothetical protein
MMTPVAARLKTIHWQDAALGALFFLLALLLYRAPLFDGRQFYFRDFQIFYTPMKHFLAEAIRHGEWAFWNPHVMMGSPFFADPQSGMLYPPSLLLLLAQTPKALAISLVFHLLLAQIGLYRLARHYQLGRLAAATGAVIYGLGGWMISAGNMMTEVHSAAWVPWTLLGCERLWAAPNLRNTALAGVVITLQMLAGWPEMFLMIGVVLVMRRLATPGMLTARWLLLSVLAALLATLIFAPQLLATWEAYTHSMRVGGMTERDMLEFSATAEQWRSLVQAPALSADNWNILAVFPDGHVPLTLSMYVGPVAIVLALLGLVSRNRLAFSWLLVIAVGMFLALGAANPLAVALLKLTNRFRSPEKYLYLVHLGIALLAALGAARLQRSIRRPLAAAAIGCVLLAGIGLDLVLANSNIDLKAEAGYYDLNRSSDARMLAVAAGRVYSRSLAAEQHEQVRPLYAAFHDALAPNIGTIAGISYLNGVSFLQLREQALALGLVEGQAPDARLARRLGFLGTQYVMTDDPAFAASAGWSQLARRLSDKLWRLEQSAPLLGFPARVVPLDDIGLYSAIEQDDFASGTAAFVAPTQLAAEIRQEGVVDRISERPGRIDANVTTATGALLVLRQFAYPGWHASVDGKEAALVPVNRFFIGVEVPPGAHQVRFRFEPSYWQLGLVMAAIGLLGLSALLVAGFRSPATNPSGSTEQ